MEKEIENWFMYHAPTVEQLEALKAIREKARELAIVINKWAPRCADTTAALRLLREAVMTANGAVVIPRVEGSY